MATSTETYTTEEQIEIDAIKRRVAERLHDPKRDAKQAAITADANAELVHLAQFLRHVLDFPLALHLLRTTTIFDKPVDTPERVIAYVIEMAAYADHEGNLDTMQAVAMSADGVEQ